MIASLWELFLKRINCKESYSCDSIHEYRDLNKSTEWMNRTELNSSFMEYCTIFVTRIIEIISSPFARPHARHAFCREYPNNSVGT